MVRATLAAPLLLALSIPALAAPPTTIGEVAACLSARIEASAATFKGNATCPAQCAHCHEAPPAGKCPDECQNAKVFCGCAGIMYQALEAAKTCCAGLSGLLLLGCAAGTIELDKLANDLYTKHCTAKTPAGKVMWPDFEAAATKAMASSALQADVAVDRSGASAYVSAHRMGAACVGLLEGMEREQASLAEQQGEMGEVPDLHAAASQIASRASGMLGAELPALQGQVHKAMTVAWTEDGPGLDADGICEVILKHHDSM